MKKFIFLVLLFWSNILFAFDFNKCDIYEIVVANGNVNAHVRLSCEISNLPLCATAKYWLAIDRSTDAGKQWLSLSTVAFAGGMKVTGFVHKVENSCPVWQSNVALLSHLRVTK